MPKKCIGFGKIEKIRRFQADEPRNIEEYIKVGKKADSIQTLLKLMKK